MVLRSATRFKAMFNALSIEPFLGSHRSHEVLVRRGLESPVDHR